MAQPDPASTITAHTGRKLQATVAGEVFNPNDWSLLWSDEFNGNGGLDWGKWEAMVGDGSNYDTGKGWGNQEEQTYTDNDNVDVIQHKKSAQGDPNAPSGDGFLAITARKSGNLITSARIRTRLDKYSWSPQNTGSTIRVSMRIKLPQGQGLWGSAWMLPSDGAKPLCSACGVYGRWPASGEIDIMEAINSMDSVQGNLHFGGQYPIDIHTEGNVRDTTAAGTFAGTWHTFAIEWSPSGTIVWKLDDVGGTGGRVYYSAATGRGGPLGWFTTTEKGAYVAGDAPFNRKFHILLNLAVGGSHVGVDRATSLKTLATEKSMLIDWVRVHKRKSPEVRASAAAALPEPLSTKGFKLLWADEFNQPTLSSSDWEVLTGNGQKYDIGKGWGNKEEQVYSTSSVSVKNGNLRLVASRAGGNILSGRLRTNLTRRAFAPSKQFPKIRISARIKLPQGAGLHGVLNLLPAENTTKTCIGCGPYGAWPASGAIDIASSANDMSVLQGTVFFGAPYPEDVGRFAQTHSGDGKSLAAGYHTFTLDWSATRLTWAVDGRIFYSVTSGRGTTVGWYSQNKSGVVRQGNAPFDRKFYIQLQLAVGGIPTGHSRADCLKTLAGPKVMAVDWVRVYGQPA